MDFFGREQELALLEKSWEAVEKKARMVVITGRRRIGKTFLSLVYTRDKPHLYLFIAKKTEILLCQEFVKQIQEFFNIPVIGELKAFREVFTLLLELALTRKFVLIIDEIQEFLTINPSIFSEIQDLWDRYLSKSKIQLIMMGSIYSLMHKIFEDSHEPLFGRADRILQLKPFTISQLKRILELHGQKGQSEPLFNYYLLTGGVPKYVELLLTEGVFEEKEILDFVLSENSPFLHEGKNVLIEEFGKEYGIYFSILELIAGGKTSRTAIESILQKEIGGYLDRLEDYYGVLEKIRPISSKPQGRTVKYRMKDIFLRFWFSFLYRNWTAVETSNFSYIKQVLSASLSTYKGPILEDFFRRFFAETQEFNHIGSYWEHDNTNEIDLVMINDQQKRIVIGEVKLNKSRIRFSELKKKSEKLLLNYPGYTPEYLALGLEDVLNNHRPTV
jgi:uncharacterized protein